ncbi:MAG: M48 family metalloprotease [Hyphomonadaceae bacterium]|nr:M48 family metalloprotease [Hyphomonadaceae bacterium]
MRAQLVAATLAVGVVGCAAPQTIRPGVTPEAVKAEQHRQSLYVLEARAADYRRIYEVTERLRWANADLCPRTEPSIGVRFETVHDYPRDFRQAAQELWGVSERPSLTWVSPFSPAARQLMPRDVLLAVNGRAVSPGRRASRDAFRAIRAAGRQGPVRLDFKRGEAAYYAMVEPARRCAYDFFVTDDPEANAAADGETIAINRGLLRVVQSTEQLALVIGHELAHNAMGHLDAKGRNQMMGAVGGAVVDILLGAAGANTGGAFRAAGEEAGAMMFSQAFESEADYVGLYYMQRAGYSIEGVEEFWRRMAVDHPAGIRLAYTHPTTAERFVGLSAARQEILTKQASGQPMRPTLRSDAQQARH